MSWHMAHYQSEVKLRVRFSPSTFLVVCAILDARGDSFMGHRTRCLVSARGFTTKSTAGTSLGWKVDLVWLNHSEGLKDQTPQVSGVFPRDHPLYF